MRAVPDNRLRLRQYLLRPVRLSWSDGGINNPWALEVVTNDERERSRLQAASGP